MNISHCVSIYSYHKFIKSKDLSVKSENDMDCVFGKRRKKRKRTKSENESKEKEPQEQEKVNYHSSHISSKFTMITFIAKIGSSWRM